MQVEVVYQVYKLMPDLVYSTTLISLRRRKCIGNALVYASAEGESDIDFVQASIAPEVFS